MFGLFAWLLGIALSGLVIGFLGRLVAPGPKKIGLLATTLCGIGGSILGGIVARIAFGNPSHHWLLSVVLEILAAAVLVVIFARRRHLA